MNEFIIKNNVLKKYQGLGGDVIIPEGVEIIGWEAFKNCKKLTSVVFPESLQIIKNKAFHGCSHLTELILDKNISIIEEEAFSWCSGLKKLTIGSNMQEIQTNAFWYCLSLKEVVFCDNAVYLGNVFQECENIETIQIFDVVFDICAFVENYYRDAFKNIIYNSFPYTPHKLILNRFFHTLFGEGERKKDTADDLFDDMFFPLLKKYPANPKLNENLFNRLGKSGFQKAMEIFITEKNFTSENIDSYIQIAIENQMYELQLMLTDYKYHYLDFLNPEDKLKL